MLPVTILKHHAHIQVDTHPLHTHTYIHVCTRPRVYTYSHRQSNILPDVRTHSHPPTHPLPHADTLDPPVRPWSRPVSRTVCDWGSNPTSGTSDVKVPFHLLSTPVLTVMCRVSSVPSGPRFSRGFHGSHVPRTLRRNWGLPRFGINEDLTLSFPRE